MWTLDANINIMFKIVDWLQKLDYLIIHIDAHKKHFIKRFKHVKLKYANKRTKTAESNHIEQR